MLYSPDFMTSRHTVRSVLTSPRQAEGCTLTAGGGSGVARYPEIATGMRDHITAGEFDGTDDKGKRKPLPSVSDLSESLGVSDGTVRKALAVLRTEGLIDIQQGHGTF